MRRTGSRTRSQRQCGSGPRPHRRSAGSRRTRRAHGRRQLHNRLRSKPGRTLVTWTRVQAPPTNAGGITSTRMAGGRRAPSCKPADYTFSPTLGIPENNHTIRGAPASADGGGAPGLEQATAQANTVSSQRAPHREHQHPLNSARETGQKLTQPLAGRAERAFTALGRCPRLAETSPAPGCPSPSPAPPGPRARGDAGGSIGPSTSGTSTATRVTASTASRSTAAPAPARGVSGQRLSSRQQDGRGSCYGQQRRHGDRHSEFPRQL